MTDWRRDGDNPGEFLVRLDIGNVPLSKQAKAIGRHLRLIALSLEDFTAPEERELRKHGFGSRRGDESISGHWVWTA